jgi:hypothetical protein
MRAEAINYAQLDSRAAEEGSPICLNQWLSPLCFCRQRRSLTSDPAPRSIGGGEVMAIQPNRRTADAHDGLKSPRR